MDNWNIQDVQRGLGAISFSVIYRTCNHVAQTLVGFAKEKEGLLSGYKNVLPFSSFH
jgi:hypothetical protein